MKEIEACEAESILELAREMELVSESMRPE